ncbi:5'-3' exonuclease H3TH domain-containing protein [Nocardioides sp. SYSU D00038]|uniref:5'-3' exonuclease n=1 Tax=Nocardioides sp. SYSU D00038 TaxID=2812554 RepID=UPI0019675A53|nr:5'-3' exonuclease H3TH domain-containing protein [Nocardioides sp. SYSU D00038]
MTTTVLAVDGNSLLHRAFHASAASGFRTRDGRPAWAVRGLLSQLVAAVDRVCADVVVVGFDDPATSLRREQWPTYKAHRQPKPDTLLSQLALAVEVLRELGVVVVVPPGLEADDVLASVAAQAPALGARTVLATSDRDAFALVDEHTRVLRILNGGVDASPLLDPARLELVTGVRPEQYLDLAALRGDASDNLPGVPGFGAKTAVRLLAALGTAEAAFADAADGGKRCREAIGPARTRALTTPEARERWELNRQVMTMHRTAELGLDPAAGTGTLPLPDEVVRAVYGRHDLFVPAALRALTLAEPERPRAPVSVEPHWRPAPARRVEPLPRLQPAYVQDTLF